MLLVGGSGALSHPAVNSPLALRGPVAIPSSSRYNQMWLSRALESFSLQELKKGGGLVWLPPSPYPVTDRLYV